MPIKYEINNSVAYMDPLVYILKASETKLRIHETEYNTAKMNCVGRTNSRHWRRPLRLRRRSCFNVDETHYITTDSLNFIYHYIHSLFCCFSLKRYASNT